MKMFLKIASLVLISSSIYANNVSKEQCEKKDNEEFIFAGGECINYFVEEGDIENALTIIVHGAWPVGTNTLARYSTFAANLSMSTDITTVAFSLPGYSKSSQNNLEVLTKKGSKPRRAGTVEYVEFLGKFIHALKEKFEAKTINVVSHSAGAMMSSTLSAYEPGLIDNLVLAGGAYKSKDIDNVGKNIISVYNYLDKIPKTTNYLLVYGTEDKISKPHKTIDFYNELKSRNINAKLVAAKGHAHVDLDMSDASVDAITEMFE